MKTTHVILYNVALLVFGMLGIFFLLKKVGHNIETIEYNLTVVDFREVLTKGNFPDSILSTPNFIALYSIFSSTNPMEDVDTFMNNLTQEEIPFLKLPTYRQEFIDTKMRCDQIMLRSAIKRNVVNADQISFLDVLLAMCLAGLLGGVLANLRGFFEFIREDSEFPVYLHIPYLLRPFTGMLCGMLFFFLTSIIVTTSTVSIDTNTFPFKGMITFMGLAIIAGFASQEFTEKLKAAASVLFGATLPQKEESETQNAENETSENVGDISDNPDAPSFLGKKAYVHASKPMEANKSKSSLFINRD